MRKQYGKTAVGPWIGGAVIGIAIAGAFIAGHNYWPAATTTTTATTTAPPTVAPRLPGTVTALGENTIADIAQQVNNSVVNIDTKRSITLSDSPELGMPFGGLRFFLGPGFEQSFPRKLEQKASGSGFIYRQDGYILTNNHVVGNAQDIKVTLADKRTFEGKVVGRDKYSDLAIVKIAATALPAARLGTSKNLRPGDWVVAIGSPMGLDHTVTLGIVSALNRSLSEVNEVQLIQTDAAINHGNSGGPLLNIHGEVIGINTAIRPDAQNIGFAIPIDVAREIAQQLIEHGNIARAYLGIYMQDMDPRLAKSLGLRPDTKGVIIAKTAPDGPADRAGLEQGDVIQKVDGKSITTGREIQEIVRKHKPGDTINFLVARGSQLTAIDVKVGDYPTQDESQQE